MCCNLITGTLTLTSHALYFFSPGSLKPVGVASVVPYTVFPRHTYIAPFLHRVGFSAFLGGAGYAISVGDVRNGSGIATGMLM
jgi:hypothetical protein